MKTTRRLARILLMVMVLLGRSPALLLGVHAAPANLIVNIDKFDAALDYTLDYQWALNKTANPTSVSLTGGTQAQIDYSIGVTRSFQSTFAITFVLSVENNHPTETAVFDVDALIQQPSGSPTYATSDVVNGLSVAPGEILTQTIMVPFAIPNLNAADVSPLKVQIELFNLANVFVVSGTRSASINFKNIPSAILDESITITDDLSTHGPWNVSGSTTITYSEWLSAGSVIGTHTVTNTASANPSEGLITSQATVTIQTLNTAPIANDDTYLTDEETSLTVPAPGVLSNDIEADGQTLTISLISDVSHGSLTLNNDGSFNYLPAVNFFGSDSFVYRISDGYAHDDATVTITVKNVQDAPAALADTYSTAEDTLLVVATPGVLANDSDVDGDSLSAILVSDVAHGSLTLNSDGSFSYTPALNYTGDDSFSYKTNDGLADSNVVTVTIHVTPVNDAPVAIADAYNLTEDTPLVISAPGILGNDSDVDGDSLSAILVSDVTHGTLSLNADGSFTYTPAANYTGFDGFSYYVSDGTLTSNVTTVSLKVNPVNDAPVGVNDSYTVAEDTLLTVATPGVLVNDSDVDGDVLSAILEVDVSNGTLTLNADGSFSYMPDVNYVGTDGFSYRVSDGSLTSSVVTVTLTVTAVNDAPVALNDAYTLDQDGSLTVVVPGVLANDVDAEGDPLTTALVSDVAHGSLTLNSDGSFSYTPNAGYVGTDSFVYRVNDGTTNSNDATVTLTIQNINDAPVALADSYSTPEDTPLVITVPGVLVNDSDVDGDALSAILEVGPLNGVLIFNSNGSFTYTPNLNYVGSDSFTYHADDGSLASSTTTVTITVTAVNDAPIAIPLSLTVVQGLTVTGTLGASDVDDTDLDFTLTTAATNGTAVVGLDGSFSYTHNGTVTTADSFIFTVTDPDGLSASALVSVTILIPTPPPANLAPTASPLTLVVVDGGTVLGQLSGSDPEGAPLSFGLISAPASGSASVSVSGVVTYTHFGNAATSDSFIFSVSDGDLSSTAVVSVTIIQPTPPPPPVNTAPLANPAIFITQVNVGFNNSLAPHASDPEGNVLTFILISEAIHGAFTLNADGSFSYIPDANFAGSDYILYQVSDGTESSNIATATITIEPNEVVIIEDEETPLAVVDQSGWWWLLLLPLLWLLWFLRPNMKYTVINSANQRRTHYRRLRKPNEHVMDINVDDTKLEGIRTIDVLIYKRFAKKLEGVSVRFIHNGHYVDSTTIPDEVERDFSHVIELDA